VSDIPPIVMRCKTCGQEDGRPIEALLRADLVDAKREIERLREALDELEPVRLWTSTDGVDVKFSDGHPCHSPVYGLRSGNKIVRAAGGVR